MKNNNKNKKHYQDWEKELPYFLLSDIDKIKEIENENLKDCYYDQLNSSINVAEVEKLISKKQANYLRNKYLK